MLQQFQDFFEKAKFSIFDYAKYTYTPYVVVFQKLSAFLHSATDVLGRSPPLFLFPVFSAFFFLFRNTKTTFLFIMQNFSFISFLFLLNASLKHFSSFLDVQKSRLGV